MNRIEQAIHFRKVFSQEIILGSYRSFPVLQLDVMKMQLSLITEELGELISAINEWRQCDTENLTGQLIAKRDVLKELADLVFVCYQLAAFLGLDLDEAMNRIFESNMTKVGPDGRIRYAENGKVMKGENYMPPDLTDLV